MYFACSECLGRGKRASRRPPATFPGGPRLPWGVFAADARRLGALSLGVWERESWDAAPASLESDYPTIRIFRGWGGGGCMFLMWLEFLVSPICRAQGSDLATHSTRIACGVRPCGCAGASVTRWLFWEEAGIGVVES